MVAVVAVAIGGVATMYSLHLAMSRSISVFLEGRGPRNCDLLSRYTPERRGRPLTLADSEALQGAFGGRATFSPSGGFKPYVELGALRLQSFVLAIDPVAFYAVTPWAPKVVGRPLLSEDSLQARRVAVVNAEAARQLGLTRRSFQDADLRILDIPFEVVGIEEAPKRRNGDSSFTGTHPVIWIPLRTYLQRLAKEDHVSIAFRVAPRESIEKVAQDVGDSLRKLHYLSPGDSDDFYMLTPGKIADSFDRSNASTKLYGWLISASGFVLATAAVLGMVVLSVSHRRVEIGIKCAVGARRRQVLGELVLEFVSLTLVGALVGTALSWLAVSLIRMHAMATTATSDYASDFRPFRFMEMDWKIVVCAMLLTLGIGAADFAALTYRIARLDPARALRA